MLQTCHRKTDSILLDRINSGELACIIEFIFCMTWYTTSFIYHGMYICQRRLFKIYVVAFCFTVL